MPARQRLAISSSFRSGSIRSTISSKASRCSTRARRPRDHHAFHARPRTNTGDDHRPRQREPGAQGCAAKLGGLVADLNSATARRAELATEAKRIADDQERVRQNLAAVGQSSDLGRRYVDTLRKQEDRLAEIAAGNKAIETEMAQKRKTAEELAKNLSS